MENGKKSAYPNPNYPNDSGLTKRELFAIEFASAILKSGSCPREKLSSDDKPVNRWEEFMKNSIAEGLECADELLKQLDQK